MNMQRKPNPSGEPAPSTGPLAGRPFPQLVSTAYADTPAVGAFGAILAASVTATGAILAAGILATGAIGAAIINDDDEDKPREPIIAPGTPPSERRVGQADLQPVLREFIGRDVFISAASSGSSGDEAGSVASVKANYALDGDVKLASTRVQRFTFRDTIIFRLEIRDLADAKDVPVTFAVDSLALSTVDVNGTDGHADITFTAIQDEQVLWRWSAHVSQGKKPTLDGPKEATHRIVRRQKDLLMVRNLLIPVRYAPPENAASTVVEVRLSSEGAGVRL